MWPYQSRLPPDGELADLLGVGTNTIRRALGLLAGEGLVERRRGSGTVVIAGRTSRRTPTIGLLVPSAVRYFRSMITGVQDTVHMAGGRVLVRVSRADPTREFEELEELIDLDVDGMALVPSLTSLSDLGFVERMELVDVPIVLAERLPYSLIDGAAVDSRLSTVVSDVHRAGVAAVHHLVKSGRTRIGLISSRDTPTSETFHRGFLKATHDLGLTFEHTTMRWPFGQEEAQRTRQRVRRYVTTLVDSEVDAVVCFDNQLAGHLLRQLSAVGLDVPGDVAVIAYDHEDAPNTEIPLTAVVPARYEVGRLAAQVLVRQIEVGSRTPTTHTLVAPELVVGASTDAIG